MKIDAIRLRHVRRFGAAGLALDSISPKLNVLAAPNEYGKSTILAALRHALFTKASSKASKHPDDIGNLVPWGTQDDPYVEVDFSLPQRSFRVRKCFAQGRKSTLAVLEDDAGRELARGDDAQRQLAELIGSTDPSGGMPGLFWMSQGAGLEPAIGAGEEKTLSSLLSDEVTDVLGGRETANIIAQIDEAIGLFEGKSGKLRKGSLLAEVIDELHAVDAAIAALRAALRDASDQRAELAKFRRRRSALADPAETEAKLRDLAAAEAALDEAQKNADLIGHTDAEVRNLQEVCQHRADKLKSFDEDLNQLFSLEKKISSASQARAEVQAELSSAEAEKTSRQERLAAAGSRLQEAQRMAEKARLQTERQARANELTGLRARLKRARATAADRDQAAEAVASITVDAKAVMAASTRLASAEGALKSAAPVLTVVEGEAIDVSGSPLGQGESQALTGTSEIRIGGSLLRIDARLPKDVRSEADAAKRELDRLLREAGVRDVAEALAAADRRAEAVLRVKSAQQLLAELAPDGIEALAALVAQVATDAEPEDIDAYPPLAELQADREAAAEAKEAAEAAERAANERFNAALREFDRAASELGHHEAQIKAIKDRLGSETEREAHRRKLAAELETARDQLGALRQKREALLKTAPDLQALTATRNRLRDIAKRRGADLAEVEQNLARLEGALSKSLGEGIEEKLEEAEGRHAELEKERLRLELRRSALKLLREELRGEAEKRRSKVLAPIMERALPMAAQVFGPTELHFGSDLNLKEIARGGESAGIDLLSGGTREQVAMITRFAFARLAASAGQPTPLILDDPFVFADDDRVARLFDLLHLVAEETQVIVLSCHERLFDDLGGHRLTPIPFPEAD